MPIRSFSCDGCDKVTRSVQPIMEDECPACEHCGGLTYRDYSAEGSGGRNHTGVFAKPIEMHSIALCHPDDIAEFKTRNPDIECPDDPNHPLYGVPLARTRQEKLRALEDAGFEERN